MNSGVVEEEQEPFEQKHFAPGDPARPAVFLQRTESPQLRRVALQRLLLAGFCQATLILACQLHHLSRAAPPKTPPQLAQTAHVREARGPGLQQVYGLGCIIV